MAEHGDPTFSMGYTLLFMGLVIGLVVGAAAFLMR